MGYSPWGGKELDTTERLAPVQPGGDYWLFINCAGLQRWGDVALLLLVSKKITCLLRLRMHLKKLQLHRAHVDRDTTAPV